MSKTFLFRAVFLLTAAFLPIIPVSAQSAAAQKKVEPLKEFKFRQIGPFRGGRVAAVEGISEQPNVYYFGATGGGVWKTTDSGTNWINISDGYFKSGSVGAMDAADSNPNVLYVGMGEHTLRGNVSSGDGVYRSNNGGKSWTHIGLSDTQQISRVRVHPTNPDLVYVAALGHLWGKNTQRGIFRSKDGGKNWEKILYRNDETGSSDLILDPSDPNTIYASFWQMSRKPYRMDSGGDGSGLFKSTDGGDSWTEISRNKGLPTGVLGKICITVSPVNTNRVWAMVEAKDGGLYRSDDAGESWQRISNNAGIKQRPWYFSRVYADTQNENTVYVLNVQLHKSIDGGRNFSTISAPHGDHHDMWIAPNDASRIINGNDGGANVSNNGGAVWSEQDQATAQFYRLAVDNDFPYNIYGAQQDNSTIRIASRSSSATITDKHWFAVGGGESGWIAPHPDNSDVVFAGSYDGLLTRYDRRTGQDRNIDVYPENPMGSGVESMKYRFQWNFPILFSPHRSNGKYPLYTAANTLFSSINEGQSWQQMSPDLTRDDKSKQKTSGGPISQDNTSVEYYGTIFTVDESPVKGGIIWTGSDDGLVHVTQDNGKTWSNITPKDIPEWLQINEIRASPFDPGTAYFAATGYKNNDQKPYLYKTSDFGKTWKKIVNGIADDHFTRTIIEDPNKRGFLFAGTERGLYFSANDGAEWKSLQLNLPVTPITDLEIHKREKDLVVATQGRSFWILDDLPVLYQLAEAERSDHFLFKPEDAYRTAGGGFRLPPTASVGQNPPNGVVTHYYLKAIPTKEIALEYVDQNGKILRSFTKQPGNDSSEPASGDTSGPAAPDGPQMSAEIGLNTFVWNFRLPNATSLPGLIMWGGSLAGPKVPPGSYSVRFKVDGKVVASETFSVKGDSRLSASQEDFGKQFALMLKINAKLTETHKAILDIRELRQQLDSISRRLRTGKETELADTARNISKQLTEVEEVLIQTKIRSSQDALNFPIKLNNKLAALGSSIDGSDDAPTDQAYEVYDDLTSKIDRQLAQLNKLITVDIAEFNKEFVKKNLPVINSGK